MGIASWLQAVLRSRRKRANRQTARRHRAALFPSLFVRELEDRRVLSVDTVPWVEPFRHLVIDASPPADDGAANSFHAARQGEYLELSIEGEPSEPVHLSSVSSVRVQDAAGVESLRIDFSGSNPLDATLGYEILVTGFGELQTTDFSLIAGPNDTLIFSGDLDLNGGNLYATAGSILVEGRITSHGADVLLDAGAEGTLLVSGTIDVSNPLDSGVGGQVFLLGDRVGLYGDARIDASGDGGGGRVLIGGDLLGANPSIRNAWATYVGSDVSVSADGMTRGDGGTIVVWSDGVTRVSGTLTARGGSLAGDGGLIETSGHQLLVATTPDLSAPSGTAGLWLLDPEDITITDTTSNITSSGSGDPGPVNFAPTDDDTTTTLDAADIIAALNAGSNVTIVTASGGTTTPGVITVDAQITKAEDGGNEDGPILTLDADDAIILNQAITSSNGPLDLVLKGTVITENVSGDAFSGGTLTVQGDLSPGLTDTGTFEIAGSMTFAPNSRFLVNLNGTNNFDQLIVNGDDRTVTLGGAHLVLTLDSVPAAGSGDVFKIVDTTGASSTLDGVFKNADGTADLDHGDIFTVGDTVFRIEYIDGDVLLTEANTPPTLTEFAAPVATTLEDTQVEITFAALSDQGDEADVDGTVTAFVVQSVASGTLKIGVDAGSATAFEAGTNDTIDASNNAYWTPALNEYGTLDAFAVVARDNSGAVSTPPVTAQVSVTPVNDPPTLIAMALDPTFIEGGGPVVLYSDTSIDVVEAGDLVKTLELTVSGLENGDDEILVVDGTSVTLVDGTSGTTSANEIHYSVSVSGGTATVTLTKTGDMDVDEAEALVNGLQYENTSNDPSGDTRTVTLTSIQDSGGTDDGGQDTTTLDVASTVTIVGVNDPPTLTATGDDPTFTEKEPPVTLYSDTSIDVVEEGDRVKTLVLTVSDLENGPDEILVVDGTSVALVDGANGTTAANGIDYSVTVSGGTATVTLTKTGDMTVAEAEALVDGLAYENTSNDPLGDTRTVTLVSIQDSGGTDDGGQDTTTLDVASTVTVVGVNDPPTLTATGDDPTFTEKEPPVTLYSDTTIDVVEAADRVKTLTLTISGLENAAQEKLIVDGTEVRLTQNRSGTTATNAISYHVTLSDGTATVTLTKSGDMDVDEAEALIDGLQYENASNNPLGDTRTVTLTSIQDSGGTDDGGQDTTILNIVSTVEVVAVNDPPEVDLEDSSDGNDTSRSVVAGGGPTVIAPDAKVTDDDSPNFDEGYVRVTIVNPVVGEDVLSIRHQGDAAGQIGFDSVNVTFGGTLIGTALGGAAGTPLIVSLNDAATPEAVQALVANITYENTKPENPDSVDREIQFVVNDGEDDSQTRTAIVSIVLADTLISLSGNDLIVTDINTPTDDNWTIRLVGSDLEIGNSGRVLVSDVAGLPIYATDEVIVPLASFTGSIVLRSGPGDDAVTLDFSGDLYSRSVLYDGGVGDNQLGLSGGTFASQQFDITDEQAGSIALTGNASISFESVETVASSLNVGTTTVNFSTTGETITVSDSGLPGQTTVESDHAPSITFANPTVTLALNAGGTNDDTIDITDLGSGFDANLMLDGQASGDTVRFSGAIDIGDGGLSVQAQNVQFDAPVAARTLSVTGSAVTQTAALTIADAVSFFVGASDLTLTEAGNQFGGALDVSAGTAQLTSASGMRLGTVSTNSLILTAGDAITGTASTSVTVLNAASLTGTSITLADEADALLDVGGHAGLTATGAGAAGTITIGDLGMVHFGSLTFNAAGAVAIHENSNTELVGINTAGSLVLVSTGALTAADHTVLTAASAAQLTGTSITLADSVGDLLSIGGAASLTATGTGAAGTITIGDAGMVLFGTLTFNASGAVMIQEDAATELSGVNTAGSLVLVSPQALSAVAETSLTVADTASLTGASIALANDADALLSVGGDAEFTALGAGATGTITLGDAGTVLFGTLNFNASGAVAIQEDADTSLTGFNTADSLVLESAGALTNTDQASLIVAGTAHLAGVSITLGDHVTDSIQLGSLNATGGVIWLSANGTLTVIEASATVGDLTLQTDAEIVLVSTLTTAGGTIRLNSPIVLAGGPAPVQVESAGGDVLFNASVDSLAGHTNRLAILAGTGSVMFSDEVGGANPLGGLAVLEAGDIEVAGPVTVFDDGIQFVHTGTLTIEPGAYLIASGSVIQGGGGPVVLGANITSFFGDVHFAGPIRLLGMVGVDTSLGGGTITWSGPVEGGDLLLLSAGAGDVSIGDFVDMPGDLIVASARNVSLYDVSAANLLQMVGSGTTTLRGSVTVSSTIDLGAVGSIAGGIVLSSPEGPIELSTGGFASPSLPDLRMNADVVLESDARLVAVHGVVFTGTIDSQPHAYPSLEIQAGRRGVFFGDSVGDGGSGRELGTLTVQTTGVLSIHDGGVLRTATSVISKLPLRLNVDEKDPGVPFGSGGDRVQRLVGIAEGTSFLTVQWADADAPGPPQMVTGGDVIRLFTSETGDDTWVVISSGDGSGAIVMEELAHEYPIAFLLQLVTEGQNELPVIVTLTSDQSIRLEGRATEDGEIQDLSSTTAKAVSVIPAGQITFTPQAIQFQPPVPLLPITIESRPVAMQANPPTIVRTEEIQTAVEVSLTATRDLVIVQVGPLGEEGEPHLLPDDALEDLEGLFERFVEEGLPNGRYRIYLREIGFPPRKLLEFYKSGRSIGDPVREPGPGSNPLTHDADFDADAAPEREAEAESAGSGAPSAESVDEASSEARSEETDGTLPPLTTASAIAASAAWQASRARERWPAKVKQAMEQAEPRRFTRGARWRRLVERGTRQTKRIGEAITDAPASPLTLPAATEEERMLDNPFDADPKPDQ